MKVAVEPITNVIDKWNQRLEAEACAEVVG
jgi:hypothetical protein